MTSEQGEFWDKRYLEEGAIWGDDPSPTAVALASLLDAHSRVLDVGFGYGRDLVYLAEQGHSVSGIEPSLAGLALARRHLEERGLRAETLYHGRFEDAELPSGQFDAVLNHRMGHLLTSRDAVDRFAASVRRVLRPDGLVALAARSIHDHDPALMVQVEPGVHEYRTRPGHRIRYWDDDAVRLFCTAGFDLLTLGPGDEPETVARPAQCHLLVLVARKASVRPASLETLR